MALVLVLSLVVIFSLLTVAFLFLMRGERVTSGNYGNSMASGHLLDAASELVLNEIQQEIRAGSNVTTPLHGTGNPGQEIFLPLNSYLSQPAVLAAAEEKLKFPNLTRRSARASFQSANSPTAANYPFTTNPFTLLASEASTTAPARNGPKVTPEKWNRPALLNPNELASFQAPDWVMMTRDGPLAFDATGAASLPDGPAEPSNPAPDNSSYVLGRFAYVVYTCNNGLDIAAAGGPATGLPTDLTSRKRILPFADLTTLPGFSAGLLDQVLRARNTSTRANVYNSSNPADPATFVGWATGSNHGFLRPANGDQRILSRQELLGLLERNGTDLSTSTLGQYLTVFSRETNSPVIVPDPARPRIQAGFPYEGKDDEYNPPLPKMVYPSDLTIAPDGTLPEPLTLRKGSPLVSRRFALSRLSWITPNGPSALNGGEAAGTANNIKRYFGLSWDATNKRWIYEHGDPDKILTLAELQNIMAAEQREPDFFELLKATIPAGSLALEGNTSTTQPTVAAESTNLDLHIFKIAANIIDQSDTDGYPTILTYSNGGGFPEAYGIEDLPYLNKMFQIFLRPAGLNELRGYLLPEVFRPHYAANSTPAANAPTNFRVVVREDSYAGVKTRHSRDPRTPGNGVWSQSDNSWQAPWGGITWGTLRVFSAADENNSAVEFSVDSANSFTSPAILTGTNSSTTNADNKVTNEIHSGVFGSGNWTAPNGYTFTNVGQSRNNWNLIYVNKVTIPATTLGVFQAGFYDYTGATVAPPNLTIGLQYNDGNSWRTYSEWKNITVPQHTTTNTQGRPVDRHFLNGAYHFMKLDPRTDRIGAAMQWNDYQWGAIAGVENRTIGNPVYNTSGYRASLFRPWCGNAGANYNPAARFHWDGLDSPANNESKWQQWTQLQRNTEGATNSYYHDPDGVVRPGDGRYAAQHSGSENSKIGSPLADTANYVSRPVILNRPFRSVAELGYVYRDLPWRSLDFFSSNSADAAFLDVFSVDENPPVRAGVVSLNTPFPEVLRTLLRVPGSALQKQEVIGTTPSSTTAELQMQPAEANNLAAAIVAETKVKPLLTKAELVTRLAAGTAVPSAYASNNTRAIKARRESFVRALADSTETRTWNLMIDLVVQAGKYPAKRPVTNVTSQFVVEAERRIWWHLAIDRYTGEIIDQQIEPVYE